MSYRTIPVRLLATLVVALALLAALLPGLSPTAEATKRIEQMDRGTSLKAEPSFDHAPANPLCSEAAWAKMRAQKRAGATSVELVIPVVQTSVKSSVIRARKDAPSTPCLRSAIRHAKATGLRPYLRVLLEFREPVKVKTKSGGHFFSLWRGRIAPTNLREWEQQYTTLVSHYAKVGEQERAYSIVIGTEMASMTKRDPAYWSRLVDKLHQLTDGIRIGYAASLPSEAMRLPKSFVRKLDPGSFGVTIWPNVDVKDSTFTKLEAARVAYDAAVARKAPASEVSALRARYVSASATAEKKVREGLEPTAAKIEKVSKRYGRRVLVYELGARSRVGTHADLADGTKGGRVGLEEQRVLVRELLGTIERSYRYVGGVHMWLGETRRGAGGRKDSGYSTEGKPAAREVVRAFGGK